MRKFTAVESSEVVSSEGQQAIAAELSKIGKTSAANLSDDERRQVDLDKR